MNKIREKRESMGLTLKELSEKINVHFTTVSDWELDKKNPKPKNKLKLADTLKCDVIELFPSKNNEESFYQVQTIDENINTNDSPHPSPFAKYRGELFLGNTSIDCYVLDTENRVISFRGTLKAIAGREGGNLAEYIGVQGLKDYINKELVLAETIEFNIPGIPYMGKGIKAEAFLDICNAYVMALRDGTLTTNRQKSIAITCSILMASCAKIGLIALIDEATGYQYERKENALQLKLKAFIADELRAWEKTFPDELWEQFGRLTKWKGSLHSRPKWWGKLVMELIYDALDPDVANYLRDNKPPPAYKRNYHQWLTENYGLKQLITHIYQIIGIAKTCNDIKELKYQIALYYSKKPIQLALSYNQPKNDY